MTELRIDGSGALFVAGDEMPKNCIIVVSNGKVKLQPLHDYGTVEIKTHQGVIKQISNTENLQF